eukprot:CAMPEP_0183396246 /NCGR_PEP_ID=MMETSP0370-20130417/9898_1 /TAXON_ID=268820 /ORGANISM="Peridinium aciculiferum, Strain PAER-2" /LENGTH=362 /DNA_ID=CAMNT_0025577009 /DNA_START=59 /DNA_END=1147 /DNA_ORIENTATION=+
MNANASAFVPGRNPNAAAFVPWQPCTPAACSTATVADPSSGGAAARRATEVDCSLITTQAELQGLLRRLASERLICIDTEGCDLSKGSWRNGQRIEDPAVPLHGQVCLLQIGTENGEAYAIDLYEMGPSAFTSGLRQILENPQVTKVVHDFRQDEDALWHQFGVLVQGKFDCQLADVFIRRLQGHRTGYVMGSAKLFSSYGIELGVLPGYGALTQEQKLKIHERFSQDRHLWSRRPLPDDMVQYAKFDVLPLPQLYQKQLASLANFTQSEEVAMRLLRVGSEVYNAAFRVQPACRCRLCCDAGESARFDGNWVLTQLAASSELEPWLMQCVWRTEDAQPLSPPGASKFYVNEHDESVPLDRA